MDTLNQELSGKNDYKIKKLKRLVELITEHINLVFFVEGDLWKSIDTTKLALERAMYEEELRSLTQDEYTNKDEAKLDYDCGETLIGESGVDIDGYTIKYSPAEAITYKEREIALLKAKIETMKENPQYKDEIESLTEQIEELESTSCDLDRGSKLFD